MTVPLNLPAYIGAGKVAVITGGAKGIGFATAKVLASIGMKIAIADYDKEALEKAGAELAELLPNKEKDVLTSFTNVGDLAEVIKFKEEVYKKFGEVSLLMNNAAISATTSSWSHYEEWRKQLDINLYGVIHGQQAFVGDIVAQGKPAAIVNVGSKQGITNPPGNPAYNVSKAAVKIMTEQLSYELRNTPNCNVSAHLLVPGYTFTNMTARGASDKPAGAWTAQQVAERLLVGLSAGDFYNEVTWEVDQKRMQWGAEDPIKGRPALSRWHPDHTAAFQEHMKK